MCRLFDWRVWLPVLATWLFLFCIVAGDLI
jgi:hypothetical protein